MPLKTDAAARKGRNSPLSTTLEHRHFAFIAAVIACTNDFARGHAAHHFADACARSNPRFDRARFLSACGIGE